MRKNLSHYFKLCKTPLIALGMLASTAQAQVLFDNGPIFNLPGAGGAANQSVLYTTTFGMANLGFGQQQTAFNRIADDFVLAASCSLRIDSVVIFGYQTGSTTTSTFTNVNLRIWNNVPDQVGSTVVFGDTTTNRLIRSAWSGTYRVTETTTGNTQRPIMRNVLNTGGLLVTAGTYWLDWSSAGSLASGPWAPPRTPANTAITGNGRQRTGATWINAVDGGTATPAQGFPFIVYGAVLAPAANAGSDLSLCPGSTGTLGGSPAGSGGSGALTYSWSPTTGLSNAAIGNPIVTPAANTTYVLTVQDAGGCIDLDTINVTLGSVAGNFLPNDTTICPGSGLTLTATTGTSYLWSTGATTQSITVTPGTYSVTVQDAAGCSSSDSIVVTQAVAATISGDSIVCGANPALLVASTNNASYLWSNGDTTQVTAVLTAGTYSVTVTVGGCSTSASFTVTAAPSPSAGFSFNNTNLTYNFSDLSSGGPTTWNWAFGDGSFSTAQNPAHTYAASGSYTVNLIVSNSCGADTFSTTLLVVGIEGSLLGAVITVSPVPATNQFAFNVQGLNSNPLQVALIDLQGRNVATWSFENPAAGIRQSVETSEFARGIYLLRFSTEQGTELRKIILE
jgi:PKD repeat protein